MKYLKIIFLFFLTVQSLFASSLPLRGQYTHTYFVFDVYIAKLFMPEQCKDLKCDFTLQLTYLRDFEGADIADRSIKEIDNQYNLDTKQKQRYHKILNDIFVDVSENDVIDGKMLNGYAEFYLNNKPLGKIKNQKLSGYFFDIWLSDKTSEPKMRKALLGSF